METSDIASFAAFVGLEVKPLEAFKILETLIQGLTYKIKAASKNKKKKKKFKYYIFRGAASEKWTYFYGKISWQKLKEKKQKHELQCSIKSQTKRLINFPVDVIDT